MYIDALSKYSGTTMSTLWNYFNRYLGGCFDIYIYIYIYIERAHACVNTLLTSIWTLGDWDSSNTILRSITLKFATPTAPSYIDNSWRSTTLSPPKKLTSSTANLEWCHVHFIRDLYSTFIHRVIGPSKNSMELFFNAKFDFKSTWNIDSTASHHKHPGCQSPTGDAEKLTNRIINNWHRCCGVMWRKRKHYSDK